LNFGNYPLSSNSSSNTIPYDDEGKFRELVQLKEFIEDLEAMINRLDIACMDWR